MKPIQQFDPSTPPSVKYCVSAIQRDSQIRINNKLVKGRVEPVTELDSEPVAIVGYGPSLNDTWEQLKDFKTIFSCSGATKFLLEKGLDPKDFDSWSHIDVDPRAHKKELLGIHPEIEYLMASAVHPEVIKHLIENDAKIKLWHIFAQDGESEQVLPRGEYWITGGCDAGMRAMTIARILGYTNLHIFGIDGCSGKTGNHAGSHPNQVKEKHLEEFEYEGEVYKTTPAWRSCAIQVFKELDQLADVEATFYGEGLTQAMSKTYKRNPVRGSLLAITKDPLISDEMREQNAQLHRENIHYGAGGAKYAELVISLVQQLTKAGEMPPSVLDYGCGKGYLSKELPFPIYEYDPGIPGKDELAKSADIVMCTDVLEHIEPEKIDAVIDDLKRVTKQVGYLVIHLGPAGKTYPNGQNAHVLQKSPDWWYDKLNKHFTISKCIQKDVELHVVVAPKDSENFTKVGDAQFYTPNDVTRWRAKTILTKEPITIEWINSMQEGETLFDIGANVGGYSILAGLRGVNVYAFEPEAENFAILTRNLAVNGLAPNAFPMAVTDKSGFDVLHLSNFGAGGSCHSFRDELGFDGSARPTKYKQGCIGITLDALMDKLPQPDHIKIDVDGLEEKVIMGAIDTLKGVKSLLIEVNPKIPKHLEMMEVLKVLGFTYDEKQAEKARRKEGPFEGVGEIIFTKNNSVENHLIEAIEDAVVLDSPYPHFVIENAFPEEYFNQITEGAEYLPIADVRPTKGYPERFVGKKAFPELLTTRIKEAFLAKFGLDVQGEAEGLLIKDKTGYAIGPHTDSPARILSAIFYLSGKDGTTMYVPNDPDFTCKGGPHYPPDNFKEVATVLNRPNTAFVFLKTDKSFHGVKKTKEERGVLLYDIRRV